MEEVTVTCNEFTSLIDGYLARELATTKQEAFELHYFECDDCFAQLKVAERFHSKEIPIVLTGKQKAAIWQWSFNWKPAAAFASLLVIVLASIFTINHSNHMDFLYRVSEVSAPDYFAPETRAADNNFTTKATDPFDEAMIRYKQKDYTGALKFLNGIKPTDSNPQVSFFKGVCLLFTDELKSALTQFDQIIEEMDPSYYDEAIYYKAISLLRMNKEKQALEQLNHLAEMFSPLSPKAKELIKKINP
ncbi:MAG: zf-HC2 domain-containing protein [bacterium]|nr:zf-HC2 domain-containing protein [bacterium]